MHSIKNKNSIYEIGENTCEVLEDVLENRRCESTLLVSSFIAGDIGCYSLYIDIIKNFFKYFKLVTYRIKIRIFNFQITKRI